MQYQQVKDLNGILRTDVIERTDDNGIISTIPVSSGNIDAQIYQTWLDEGNTPLPPP